MHYFLGPKSYDTAVYQDREAFFADLVKIYHDEIADLAAEGCTYLQLDDTALPCNLRRQGAPRRGGAGRGRRRADPHLRGSSTTLAKKPPGNDRRHPSLSRQSQRRAWMAEGGYDPIADVLFNKVNVDGYFLEYDTDRAGDFEPLRFVPKGKTVIVLGLVSTKTPVLETKDELQAPHRGGRQAWPDRPARPLAAMRLRLDQRAISWPRTNNGPSFT